MFSKIRINGQSNKNYLHNIFKVIVRRGDDAGRSLIIALLWALGSESFIWLTVWFLGLVTLIFLSIFSRLLSVKTQEAQNKLKTTFDSFIYLDYSDSAAFSHQKLSAELIKHNIICLI